MRGNCNILYSSVSDLSSSILLFSLGNTDGSQMQNNTFRLQEASKVASISLAINLPLADLQNYVDHVSKKHIPPLT